MPFSNMTAIGTAITSTTRITYFSHPRYLNRVRYLGVGIIYSNSCISPNGHNHPQVNLPKTAAKNTSDPTTNELIPDLNVVRVDWSAPKGQPPSAAGQE